MRTGTSYSKTFGKMMWLIALLLVVFTAGCDRDHGAAVPPPLAPVSTVPKVIYTNPADGDTDVPLNKKISAVFSEPMSAATITAPGTFTVTGGTLPVTAVTISYHAASQTAVFTPSSNLENNTTYTGRITIAAKNVPGIAMASDYLWTFMTGTALDITAPLLLSTAPVNTATNVPLNQIITATFNETMDPSTITPTSYTVTGPTGTIAGVVSLTYPGTIATFVPNSPLASSATYTVVIAANDLAGNPWVSGNVPNPWSFVTGTAAPAPVLVSLGTASTYGIIATDAATNSGGAITHIYGDVALIANDSFTGFLLTGNTSPYVTGVVNSPARGNPAAATQAQADLNIAYLDLSTRPSTSTFTPGVVELSGRVLTPGVYEVGTPGSDTYGLSNIAGPLVLDGQGDENSIFIFKAYAMTTTTGSVVLRNGARPTNVFWVVTTAATIGNGSSTFFQGTVVAGGTITVGLNTNVEGRMLAGALGAGAITVNGSVIVVPTP